MEITLHNIGVIQDASIKLDGLTVITGKNESGKTTVGKALYALLDAVSDLPQKAKEDRDAYIWKQLHSIRNQGFVKILPMFTSGKNQNSEQINFVLEKYPSIRYLSELHSVDISGDSGVEQLARRTAKELKAFQQNDLTSIVRLRFAGEQPELINLISEMIDADIRFLEQLFSDIDRGQDLFHYAREAVNQALSVEFAGQIQTLQAEKTPSGIQLAGTGSRYFDLMIQGNRIINECFFASPVRRAYFIDDPFVLDNSLSNNIPVKPDFIEGDIFFLPGKVMRHNVQLSQILRQNQPPSALEQIILDAKLAPIKKSIDEILPGTFDFSQPEKYYIRDDGVKLRVSNMAAGSKMFSIIKILLDRGLLDENAMLILDEPETHLHPAWQNQFAEMIVLLVKELRVKVLLTTHSSHFMLAIDAYMRKHKINDIANFYQARRLDNGYVTHDCVNDRMEVIYQDFLESFSEVKALRDYYDTDGDDES